MPNHKIKKKCRNCLYDVNKNIRRCPYCGILNPTIELKEIFITIIAIVTIMSIYTFNFN
jgi:RNA polymerase subunit RPABC4/transcription elongation factor Spt4